MLKIVSRKHYSSKLIIIIIIELLHLPVLNKTLPDLVQKVPKQKTRKKKIQNIKEEEKAEELETSRVNLV